MKDKRSKIVFSPPKNSIKLTSYIKKYSNQFIITAITGILFNSAIVLGPIFQGKLLDAAIASKGISGIITTGLQFIGVTLSFQIARFFKRYYVRDMANRMSGDMRVGIMESILSTDLNAIEKQKVGDMMSTTVGDVDIVVEAIRKTITEIFDTGVLMMAYWIALMSYDIKITLLATIPIPIIIALAQLMRKTVQGKSKEARKANSKTTTHIRKIIAQINILRLYGREEAELNRLKEKLDIQASKTAVATVLKNGLAPVYSALASTGIIIVIALGGSKVMDKSWTIGQFTAYIAMFMALATRTTTAAKLFNIQQGAKASWERVRGLMLKDSTLINSIENPLKPKEIIVENFSFKYPSGDKDVINNISFSAEAGMIIGITGPVGSGKSALGLALTGMYDYEGNIYLEEEEFREIPKSKKVATISYMGHDPFLFSDTVENNITWGNNNPEKLERVLNIASLKTDITKFEKGVKTKVAERGAKVSGGQRQRISLARALYKDASILILDDPFSAVDIYTEEKIIEALRENAKDKFIFIFSHRLEAFKYTDKVIVLDKGKIAEMGTHEELSKNKGIYNKIMDSQKFMGVN